MNFLTIYMWVGLAILAYMFFLWISSLYLKNSSIVDIFWGAGFVFAGWLYYWLTPQGFLGRKVLIMALVTIWGLRLSLYILYRNWGKPEDFRYQVWRKEAGSSWWWRSFFKVFLLQGLLMWIISIPLLAAQYWNRSNRLGWLDFLGILIWLVGFFFESVGDLQLALFKSKPENKGKLLDSGVWKYTRHPNYFGDATQWWGFYTMALSAGGWWTAYSPVIMTYLLLRVSGVVMLEKSLKDTKPGYKEYVERTSSFVPWFPKRKGG
jgi:steroid 5-alpha reductase family enzyme